MVVYIELMIHSDYLSNMLLQLPDNSFQIDAD